MSAVPQAKHPSRTPLLGLCPIGKFVFSHQDAIRQKKALQQKLRAWNVRYVDLDKVLSDGLVRDQAHVEPAVAHLRAQGAHAVEWLNRAVVL